jgi:hypothetical protein
MDYIYKNSMPKLNRKHELYWIHKGKHTHPYNLCTIAGKSIRSTYALDCQHSEAATPCKNEHQLEHRPSNEEKRIKKI